MWCRTSLRQYIVLLLVFNTVLSFRSRCIRSHVDFDIRTGRDAARMPSRRYFSPASPDKPFLDSLSQFGWKFMGDTEDTIAEIMEEEVLPPSGIVPMNLSDPRGEPPRGISAKLRRAVRRRILNLWGGYDTQWANALAAEDLNVGLYVTRRSPERVEMESEMKPEVKPIDEGESPGPMGRAIKFVKQSLPGPPTDYIQSALSGTSLELSELRVFRDRDPESPLDFSRDRQTGVWMPDDIDFRDLPLIGSALNLVGGVADLARESVVAEIERSFSESKESRDLVRVSEQPKPARSNRMLEYIERRDQIQETMIYSASTLATAAMDSVSALPSAAASVVLDTVQSVGDRLGSSVVGKKSPYSNVDDENFVTRVMVDEAFEAPSTVMKRGAGSSPLTPLSSTAAGNRRDMQSGSIAKERVPPSQYTAPYTQYGYGSYNTHREWDSPIQPQVYSYDNVEEAAKETSSVVARNAGSTVTSGSSGSKFRFPGPEKPAQPERRRKREMVLKAVFPISSRIVAGLVGAFRFDSQDEEGESDAATEGVQHREQVQMPRIAIAPALKPELEMGVLNQMALYDSENQGFFSESKVDDPQEIIAMSMMDKTATGSDVDVIASPGAQDAQGASNDSPGDSFEYPGKDMVESVVKSVVPGVQWSASAITWARDSITKQLSGGESSTAAAFDEEAIGLQSDLETINKDLTEVANLDAVETDLLTAYDPSNSASTAKSANLLQEWGSYWISQMSAEKESTEKESLLPVSEATASLNPALLSSNAVDANTTTGILTSDLLPTLEGVLPDNEANEVGNKSEEVSSSAPRASFSLPFVGNIMDVGKIMDFKDVQNTLSNAKMESIQEDTLTGEIKPDFDPTTTAGDVAMDGVKVDRSSKELRMKPPFVEKMIPMATMADFAYLDSRRRARVITAALAVKSKHDALEFMREIGPAALVDAAISPLPNNADAKEIRVDALKGALLVLRQDASIAPIIANSPTMVSFVCDLMEDPFRGFRSFRLSKKEKEKEMRAQRIAVALILRMVRSSDEAVEVLKFNERLRTLLQQIVAQGEVFGSPSKQTLSSLKDSESETMMKALPETEKNVTKTTQPKSFTSTLIESGSSLISFTQKQQDPRLDLKRFRYSTTIVDYFDLSTPEMARIAMWGIGGVTWKPRQPGQKGLRVLSLDGGGTRGVLTIAMLKEVMDRIGTRFPHEVFDVVAGTSTGAIIAALLVMKKKSIDEAEEIYDEFVARVFGSGSNLKLAMETAFYDERELEKVLYEMVGDQLLIDSNMVDTPRCFFLSLKMESTPPTPMIWRNYNYPPDQEPRYPGTYQANTVTAVRATSAAPTFFTPVQWNGTFYGDGALVANNPTAIALQEIKVLYPNVPLEYVVSIGTGFISNGAVIPKPKPPAGSKAKSLWWETIVNQIIATSVDTEDVHMMLQDFLATEKYYRFNTPLFNNMPIDELDKAKLADLKVLAKAVVSAMETGKDTKRVETLFKDLRGERGEAKK